MKASAAPGHLWSAVRCTVCNAKKEVEVTTKRQMTPEGQAVLKKAGWQLVAMDGWRCKAHRLTPLPPRPRKVKAE